MFLQLAIFDGPLGKMLADWSHITQELSFTTGEHGFEALRATIPMSLDEASRWFDRPAGSPITVGSDVHPGGPLHVEVNGFGMRVWEGRLEDAAIVDGGIRITALGYSRAYHDVPVTMMFSDAELDGWRELSNDDIAGATSIHHDRWQQNKLNKALNIGPTKNAIMGATIYGMWGYEVPHDSTGALGKRNLAWLSFDWDFVNNDPSSTPTTYEIAIQTRSGDAWASIMTIDTIEQAAGGSSSGSWSQSLGSSADRVTLRMRRKAGGFDAAYPGESGGVKFRAWNIRIKTTSSPEVYSDEIAAALVAFVNARNPSQASTITALIDNGLQDAPLAKSDVFVDLRQAIYQDQYPADILTRLAALGDKLTRPRIWEWGVWEGRRLHFRPRGRASRRWYIDALSLEMERTIQGLHNQVYALRSSNRVSGAVVREAIAEDANSIWRHGLRRRHGLRVAGESETQARKARDAYLDDHSDQLPRAGFKIPAIYNAFGGRHHLSEARAGDIFVIRNLSPTMGQEIDRIRTFRSSHTEYNAVDGTLVVEPESALPTLETLLMRRSEGFPT